MSLDFDYVEKVKNTDLKNILREKLNGYLANPQGDLGNSGARREALGILPPPTILPVTTAQKKTF